MSVYLAISCLRFLNHEYKEVKDVQINILVAILIPVHFWTFTYILITQSFSEIVLLSSCSTSISLP